TGELGVETGAKVGRYPAVGLGPDGSGVVAWELAGGGVLARRLGPNGELLGTAFTVDASTRAHRPAVVKQPDGSFVITWQRGAPDTVTAESGDAAPDVAKDGDGLWGDWFNPAGMPTTPQTPLD